MTQLSRSAELQEHISEIYYFLNLFSQTQLERLDRFPLDFIPCWIEPPGIHCNVNSWTQFLARWRSLSPEESIQIAVMPTALAPR